MADTQDWSSNANEVTYIKLKHSSPEATVHDVQFHPAFTYPIFGDEESIFGYRGLKVRLEFSADRLRPELDISHTAQFNPVGDVKPDDIEEALKEALPSLNTSLGQNSITDSFTPPGDMIHSYELNGRNFGIWSSSLSDPAARSLLQDAQVLILFFIEGGSRIDLEDPLWTIQRWKVFFVYAIDTLPNSPEQSVYSLIGYSTSYRLYFLEPEFKEYNLALPITEQFPENGKVHSDPALSSKLPARERISQFLILPPYQSKGHGSHLYDAMISTFMNDPMVKEITVEDPNESFDDLRDVNDLVRLRQDPAFSGLEIDHSVKIADRNEKLPTSRIVLTKTIASLREKYKIAPRQFSRLTEMQLLSNIPAHHRQLARITRKDKASDEYDRAYYFWRLLAKHRLYKHNIESLTDLDPEERVEKLDGALGAVEPDYVRLLGLADRRAARAVERAKHVNGKEKADARGARRKRVLDDDDDDDDEEEEEEDEEDDQKTAGDEDAEHKHKNENDAATLRSNAPKKRMRVTFAD